jgi:hypothetical protein
LGLLIFPLLVVGVFSFGGATHPEATTIRIMDKRQATRIMISFII